MAEPELKHLYQQHRQRRLAPVAGSGYVSGYLFEKEQRWVQAQLRGVAGGILLDAGCGYGLMTASSVGNGFSIVAGVDFDPLALTHAGAEGLQVFQGDLFQLALADACVDVVVCTQFINQQNSVRTQALLVELARVLRPGGVLLMTWRKSDSRVHQLAQFVLRTIGSRFAHFPQYQHDWQEVLEQADAAGLQCDVAGIMPLLSAAVLAPNRGQTFGVSYLACFHRPDQSG